VIVAKEGLGLLGDFSLKKRFKWLRGNQVLTMNNGGSAGDELMVLI
jgi:hypothetical protein